MSEVRRPTFLNSVLFIIVDLLLLISAILTTIAVFDVRRLQPTTGPPNTDIDRAHNNLVISSAVAWVAFVILTLLAILHIANSVRRNPEVQPTITNELASVVLLVFALISSILVGVFSSISAAFITSSGRLTAVPNNRSREFSIISAIVSILSVGVVVFLFITLSSFGHLCPGGLVAKTSIPRITFTPA